MGNAFSTPYGTPNAEQVKQILNTLLREMFRRADLVDLYSLADEDRCKNYLVVGAKALNKLFVQINLEPKKGPDGLFYFQRIEGIQRANPQAAQQKQNCLELAFFFVRIFQVFAALTISCLDTKLPDIDPTPIVASNRARAKQAIFIEPSSLPGFQQRRQTGFLSGFLGSASRRGAQVGGRIEQRSRFFIDDQAGEYTLLNSVLQAPNVPADDTSLSFDIPFAKEPAMRVVGPSLYSRVEGTKRIAHDVSHLKRNNPVIKYTRKDPLTDIQVGLEGSLSIDQDPEEPLKYKVNLTVRFNNRTNTLSMIMKKSTDRDDNPVSVTETGQGSGDPLGLVILNLFNSAYRKAMGAQHSIVRFLQKFRLIGSVDRAFTPITGSKVAIVPIPKSVPDDDKVQVQFSDMIKPFFEDKSRQVKVVCQLRIQRIDRKIDNEPQQYMVEIMFNPLTVTPESIADRLTGFKEVRRKMYHTGLLDRDQPQDMSQQSRLTIPQFLDTAFRELFNSVTKRDFTPSTGVLKFKDGIPQPIDEGKMQEGLKIKRIWEGLARDPPLKAHCVARALQLLNVRAIQGLEKEGRSSVCNLKFPYMMDGSLPKNNEQGIVRTSLGLYSLSKLFFDKLIPNAAPMVSNREAFKDYAAKLTSYFERVDVAQFPEQLADVKEKAMPYCEGHITDTIQLNQSLTSRLRQRANELLRIQAQHTGAVMNLMFKLFNRESIMKQGTLQMSEELLAGGLDYINQVATDARTLLLNYYGNCEKTYKEGLYELLDKQNYKDITKGATFISSGIAYNESPEDKPRPAKEVAAELQTTTNPIETENIEYE